MRLNGFASGSKNGRKTTNTTRACRLALYVMLVTLAAAPLMAQEWPMFGQNTANTATNWSGVSNHNVSRLKTKWAFTTLSDVSARAAVVKGVAYFPDWAGNLYAVNASTGSLIWSHQLSDYGLATGTVSRTSPAVAKGVVYIGTQYTSTGLTGWLLAIDASTGNLIWKIQPDTSNSSPVITASPVVAGGVVYVGMTSNEEYVAADPTYPCCSVIGSLVAVKAKTGKKLWQTFTAPAGYSGANIWGSHPVVDKARGTVYIGTGNNYHIPFDPVYQQCIKNGGTEASCLEPGDHADSI